MLSAARSSCIFIFFFLTFLVSSSFGKYQADEAVTLWVNKVGPYNNPQETYNYYSLPFCRPPGNTAHKWGGLGEVLGGNELIDSLIQIKFKRDVEKTKICEIELDAAKAKQFKDAIENSYWFEFFMDDLPLWGFVGEVLPDRNRDNKHVLWTHKNLVINYNGNQIIHVNLTQDNPKPLEEGRVLDMTYSVKWVPTNTTFARRFDVYLDYPFFEHQIHWFSVFNSFMMVIFLTGLVSMILMRTLRNDYAKYAREDDDIETLERDVSEESGWKLVHGDVFRPPQNLALLSAVVGTGAQLATLVLLVIILAIVGMLYIGRGAIVTTFIVCYAFTSFIAGYVSGGMYSRNGGKKWIKSMILTASLFPFLCFGIGFILNTVAIFYGSLAAIPFGTMMVVLVIWAFISFPLALLGTVVGRNWSGMPNNPCRVKTIPRPIPEKKWYLTPSIISLMGGLLPFGSIFIEMYFVFTSFWNYKVVGANGAKQTVVSGSMEVLRPCWAVATSGVPVREQLFNASICHHSPSNLFQHGDFSRTYGRDVDPSSLEVAAPILIPRKDGHRHRKGSHGDVIFLTNRGEVTSYTPGLHGHDALWNWQIMTGATWSNLPSLSGLTESSVVPTLKPFPLRRHDAQELILAAGDQDAVVISPSGSILTSVDLPGPPTHSLVTVDFSNDGLTDLILVTSNGVYGFVQTRQPGALFFSTLVGCLLIVMGVLFVTQYLNSSGKGKPRVLSSAQM